MVRPGHDQVKFFVGQEVEHSPAYLETTLFVVGLQPLQDILVHAFNNKCTHVYLGANRSFAPTSDAEWDAWDQLLTDLVFSGASWITLDYDISLFECVSYYKWHTHEKFIPMISVVMPEVEKTNSNTTIKIDDGDFNSSNSGVWCVNLHQHLLASHHQTAWDQYTQDIVIK